MVSCDRRPAGAAPVQQRSSMWKTVRHKMRQPRQEQKPRNTPGTYQRNHDKHRKSYMYKSENLWVREMDLSASQKLIQSLGRDSGGPFQVHDSGTSPTAYPHDAFDELGLYSTNQSEHKRSIRCQSRTDYDRNIARQYADRASFAGTRIVPRSCQRGWLEPSHDPPCHPAGIQTATAKYIGKSNRIQERSQDCGYLGPFEQISFMAEAEGAADERAVPGMMHHGGCSPYDFSKPSRPQSHATSSWRRYRGSVGVSKSGILDDAVKRTDRENGEDATSMEAEVHNAVRELSDKVREELRRSTEEAVEVFARAADAYLLRNMKKHRVPPKRFGDDRCEQYNKYRSSGYDVSLRVLPKKDASDSFDTPPSESDSTWPQWMNVFDGMFWTGKPENEQE